jgi:lipopolysaccharide export system permease protein
MKKLDIYIIKKFLGTFFFALILIVFIAVIFDVSENLDDFLDKKVPVKAIIFEYYINFIPYFANLFSSLFTFIAVIFFTSKMAFNTEIVAILSGGVSFRRLMWPYFISALIISGFTFFLSTVIIPPANQARIDFDNKYIRGMKQYSQWNYHRQLEPGVLVYFERFNSNTNTGLRFTLEKFEKSKMISKLFAESISWDSTTGKWKLRNYSIREFNDTIREKFIYGNELDTALNIKPEEFMMRDDIIETMNFTELDNFIKEQKFQGRQNIETYLIEKYRRIAFPFSTFILTLIGVSLASRKVRGGIGLHIGMGFLFSFAYILFMQISTTFAIGGLMSPLLAVWIPNIIFTVIAIVLYRLAPK